MQITVLMAFDGGGHNGRMEGEIHHGSVSLILAWGAGLAEVVHAAGRANEAAARADRNSFLFPRQPSARRIETAFPMARLIMILFYPRRRGNGNFHVVGAREKVPSLCIFGSWREAHQHMARTRV